MTLIIPPEPKGERRDYERYLLSTYREWRNDTAKELREEVKKDNFSLEAFLLAIGLNWSRISRLLKEVEIRQAFTLVQNRHLIWWKSALKRATGVDFSGISLTEDWLAKELNSAIFENISLIDDIQLKSALKIRRSLSRHLRGDITRKHLASDIRKILNSSESRARLIARDQVQKYYSSINQLRQQQAGIEEYIWITREDSRVRHAHQIRHGKAFRWDSPPPDGHPGQPVNCRCIAVPKFKPTIYQFKVKDRYRAA